MGWIADLFGKPVDRFLGPTADLLGAALAEYTSQLMQGAEAEKRRFIGDVRDIYWQFPWNEEQSTLLSYVTRNEPSEARRKVAASLIAFTAKLDSNRSGSRFMDGGSVLLRRMNDPARKLVEMGLADSRKAYAAAFLRRWIFWSIVCFFALMIAFVINDLTPPPTSEVVLVGAVIAFFWACLLTALRFFLGRVPHVVTLSREGKEAARDRILPHLVEYIKTNNV